MKNKATNRRHFYIFIFFFLLSVAVTFPFIGNLGKICFKGGDPSLNVWALDWQLEQLTAGNLAGLFRGNMFYPTTSDTILYSEHMFSTVLLTWPVYLISGNPQLCADLAIFISFVFAGFGMYMLGFQLTRNHWAGIIFAFSEFRVYIWPYLQLTAVAYMPFALLCLHKLFQDFKWRYLLLFTLLYLLQALACGYYFLFFSLIAALVIVLFLLTDSNYKRITPWLRLGVFVLLAAPVIGVFYAPYLQLQDNFNFTRPFFLTVHFGARLINYISNGHSWLWSNLTGKFGGIEHYLGFGFLALALAVCALFPPLVRTGKVSRLFFKILQLVILIIIVTFLVRDIDNQSQAHILARTVIFYGAIIYLFCQNPFRRWLVDSFNNQRLIYIAITLLCLLMSFGSYLRIGKLFFVYGPYYFCYKYIPGFSGIRAISRFGGLITVGIAPLAAFGFSDIFKRLPGKTKYLFAVIVPALLLAEYFPAPRYRPQLTKSQEIPAIYQWLEQQQGDFAILELPLHETEDHETYYLYGSMFHHKRLVNGFSGYVYPPFTKLREIINGSLPNQEAIRAITAFGPRYIIIHKDKNISEYPSKLGDYELIQTIDDSLIYEFSNAVPQMLKPANILQYLALDGPDGLKLETGGYFINDKKIELQNIAYWHAGEEVIRKKRTKIIWPCLWTPKTSISLGTLIPEGINEGYLEVSAAASREEKQICHYKISRKHVSLAEDEINIIHPGEYYLSYALTGKEAVFLREKETGWLETFHPLTELDNWQITSSNASYEFSNTDLWFLRADIVFDGDGAEDELVRLTKDLNVNLGQYKYLKMLYKLEDCQAQTIELILHLDTNGDGEPDEALRQYTNLPYTTISEYIWPVGEHAAAVYPAGGNISVKRIEIYFHKVWGVNCSGARKKNYQFQLGKISFLNLEEITAYRYGNDRLEDVNLETYPLLEIVVDEKYIDKHKAEVYLDIKDKNSRSRETILLDEIKDAIPGENNYTYNLRDLLSVRYPAPTGLFISALPLSPGIREATFLKQNILNLADLVTVSVDNEKIFWGKKDTDLGTCFYARIYFREAGRKKIQIKVKDEDLLREQCLILTVLEKR